MVVIPAYVVCCLPLRFSFSVITFPPADTKPWGNTFIVPEGSGAVVPTPTLISKELSASVFLII